MCHTFRKYSSKRYALHWAANFCWCFPKNEKIHENVVVVFPSNIAHAICTLMQVKLPDTGRRYGTLTVRISIRLVESFFFSVEKCEFKSTSDRKVNIL